MLNRDKLFDAMSDIRPDYLESAADLLGYYREDKTTETKISTKKQIRDTRRIILIAAAIACFLTITAFAARLFSVSERVPDPDETFRIKWSENEEGFLEWHDAKLALTFPEKEESKEIEFRPGYLPFELPETLGFSIPESNIDKDTWFTRFSAETLGCWAPEDMRVYQDIGQPLLIERYSMSMFNDGGAILMLYHTPGDITEEQWGDLDVLKFHASQHIGARPEFGQEEYSIDYNYVLLSNADEGWIITVAGMLDMDTIVKVAENLEIRQTGKILTQEDFENKYVFMDGGVG